VCGALRETVPMQEKQTEQHRIECEAREWLRRCGFDAESIRRRLARLEEKRGDVSALREEMRRQYAAARRSAA
jgi:hypothetical protein